MSAVYPLTLTAPSRCSDRSKLCLIAARAELQQQKPPKYSVRNARDDGVQPRWDPGLTAPLFR